MSRLTESQIKASCMEDKLCQTREGCTCVLTYEEAHELACYMRQRTGLIDNVAALSSRAARALCYILSIWRARGSGEVYEELKFNHDGQQVTFYYDRLLLTVESAQQHLKIIDKDLQYGDQPE